MLTHPQIAEQYCRDVLDGTIPACKWVKAAAKRHLDDLARVGWRYVFDEERANDVCLFFSLLPHCKGKWARADPLDPMANRLKLEPWQSFIICSIFGWIDAKTRFRRFRKASIYVPRKNGKSYISAGIGWWMFAYDGEPGAEVYCGATSEKQAYEVFKPARQMANRVPELADGAGVTVNVASLVIEGDGSKFEPVIGKPGDGASPHCAIADEAHEHATSELIDTMRTGMMAREQPLMLIISTAGSNLSGPCRDDWVNCEKLLSGVFEDDAQFAIIYTIDDDAEWSTEEGLAKANPNWGVSVIPNIILADLEEAKRDPKKQSAFKTKHCNLWVSSLNAFFIVEQWRGLADPKLRIEDMKGSPCCMGLDLAFKHDLTALMIVFRHADKFAVFGKYYLPRETVSLPQNGHFQKWEREGWISVNEGNVTDFGIVKDDCEKLYSEYSADEFVYDPAHATMLINGLTERGINCVDGYTGNGELLPIWLTEFDACIRSGEIVHNGDPVLSWAISNCVAKPARRGLVFLTKENNAKKIDPVIASILAFGRMITRTPNAKQGIEVW